MVKPLINSRTLYGRIYYLIRWQDHDSTENFWEPAENLLNYPECMPEYEAAAPHQSSTLQTADRGAAGLAVDAVPGPEHAPPLAPPGWMVVPEGPVVPGATFLHWWPVEGWQLNPLPEDPFRHVVRSRQPTASLTGDVDTLLDSSCYGRRRLGASRSDCN